MALGAVQTVKNTVLPKLRRGRAVAWSPPWMRFGNQLSLAMWAYEGRVNGETRWVLRQPLQFDLVNHFPVLAGEYMLTKKQTRFTDQRLSPWLDEGFAGPDWNLLDAFVREVVLPRNSLPSRCEEHNDAIVVNVRRGDYYSVPEHRAILGMNIEAFVQTAVERAVVDDGSPTSIVVVSDDIAWCRDHLGPILHDFAPVRYRPQGDAAGDLSALINAPRLIIPNSTFSTWAGHIGDAIRPGRRVYAPPFFFRDRNGGRNEENNPRWTIIEDIPGGWDKISA